MDPKWIPRNVHIVKTCTTSYMLGIILATLEDL